MLAVKVPLYGYTFTVDEAKEHFKPTGNEFASLLGWLIKPDKPKEKEKGYERPDFDAFLVNIDDEEDEQPGKVLELVNGASKPVELQVD